MTNEASNQHFQQNDNEHITIFEVKKAIDSVKRGKGTGIEIFPLKYLKMIRLFPFCLFYLIFALIMVHYRPSEVNVYSIRSLSRQPQTDVTHFRTGALVLHLLCINYTVQF